MISNFQKLLSGVISGNEPDTARDEEIRLACAALLVHCARADGDYSVAEDTRLEAILMEHFDLKKSDADEVIHAGEKKERDAVDVHRFTRVIRDNLDRDGRLQIVRYLWQVANADGNIDADERRVIGLAAKLLDVEGHDAVALRHEVIAADEAAARPKSQK
jgi:uncharacterized tellurite resistance protein B-like protein